MQQSDTALVLRVCRADGTSHEGFQWPNSGLVEAPDWNPRPICGGGLHGWLRGEGDINASRFWEDDNAKWLAVQVQRSDVVELGGKVKFPRGDVVKSGLRGEVIPWFCEMVPGSAVVFGVRTGGYGSTLVGGDCSTLTGGDCSTLMGGDDSTLVSGSRSMLIGGDDSTLTGSDHSVLIVRWWNKVDQRRRIAVGHVGEGGIEPDIPYRWDAEVERFVEVETDE